MASHYHLFKFLTKKKNLSSVDKFMAAAAVLHPLTAIPQVVLIYTSRQAEGLSMFMWLSFLILGLVFMSYGIAHRLKPYNVMQTLWIVIDISIILGIIKYG
ncbi:hypothetical protein BH10PAT3_BH10PAT3_1470 [soil metagenome]